MKKSIRHHAVDILNQVYINNSFAGDLIDTFLDENELSGKPDGRLLTHLVYGVLRLQGHLDWILSRLYRGDFVKMDEGIRNVLRTGLYQLKFSDRLPAFAVVDEAVKIAKIISPAASGLTNAILRNYLRSGNNIPFPSQQNNIVEYISAYHSHPLELTKSWLNDLGKENTLALCQANNDMPPLTCRVNTLKTTRAELIEQLKANGFQCNPTKFSPDGIILTEAPAPIQKTLFFDEGLLRLQDEGAQLISYLVNPQPGENILDVCAGSGGKTMHLAARMNNKGRIVAADHYQGKINALLKETERLGVEIIEPKLIDVTKDIPDTFIERFDHVLVDAPCSGTGTLRRNPEIKWRLTAAQLTALASTQRLILQQASKAVKKGGKLIYCTCSLLPDENENIIKYFLMKNRQFTLDTTFGIIEKPFIDGSGFFRTYPHIHDMDGFFGAVLKHK